MTTIEARDLDIEDSDIMQNIAPSFHIVPYNRDKEHDTARKYIAFTLLGTLIGVVILSFAALLWALGAGQQSAKDNFDHISGLLNIIFGPVVTLVGSATGFYFGSQTVQSANRST